MKKLTAFVLALVLVLGMASCSLSKTEKDYAAAIMVDGEIYLYSSQPSPMEVDESAIIGYTEHYTDAWPKRDLETNFNREPGMPVARVEGGVAVLRDGEWHLCTPEK